MSYYQAPSYGEALIANDIEILGSETFGDYEGDYAFVVKSADKGLGVVIIGYGSCSGCDAKEACDTKEEFEQLMESVISSIHWASVNELIGFVNDEFDDNNWYRHDKGFAEAKSALIALIKGENEHTHEIYVFGLPCDCGTRHEYCNNCDWVEPCEIEEETK